MASPARSPSCPPLHSAPFQATASHPHPARDAPNLLPRAHSLLAGGGGDHIMPRSAAVTAGRSSPSLRPASPSRCASMTTSTATLRDTSRMRLRLGTTESCATSASSSELATACAAARKKRSGMVEAWQQMAPNETPGKM
eukprot:scaffold17174_cov107-Isochrysis_galbana.AAC.5